MSWGLPRAARSDVIGLRVVNTEYIHPGALAELRVAFMVDDAGASALGWPGVHAFETQHGVVLPKPYRTFVAEITDGSFSGPPGCGLLGVAEMPPTGAATGRCVSWRLRSR